MPDVENLELCIWNVEKRELLREVRFLKPPKGASESYPNVRSVGFSADNNYYGACSGSGELRVWERNTGRLVNAWSKDVVKATTFQFLPDDDRVLIGGAMACAIWDPIAGKEVQKWKSNDSAVTSIACRADGKLAAAVGLTAGDCKICGSPVRPGSDESTPQRQRDASGGDQP